MSSELVIKSVYLPENAASLPKTKKGDKISVYYTGTFFTTGQKFDSSADHGHGPDHAFDLTLGVGQVIQGWDQGLLGMVKGEKRKLTIPPELAYGAKGFGEIIPANSILVFDVELVNVVSSSRNDL